MLRCEVIAKGQKELNDQDAAIASLQAEVKVLRQDNDALEQYGRRNNLRISSIPQVNLQPEQTEDTTGAIVDLANNILKLDPQLTPNDIEVSHQLRKPSSARNDEPCAIIVRFRLKAERYRVISNQKNLKQYNEGKNTKVNINEDLMSTRAKLFSTVRKLQKDKTLFPGMDI